VIEDRSSTTAWRHFYPAPSSMKSLYFVTILLAMQLAIQIVSPARPKSSFWPGFVLCALLLQVGILVSQRNPGPIIWIGATGLWYPGSFGKKFLPAEAMQRVLWGGDNLTIKLHDGTNATIPTLVLSSADQLELRKCVERLIVEHRPLDLPAASA
jgi:hypothetical protein